MSRQRINLPYLLIGASLAALLVALLPSSSADLGTGGVLRMAGDPYRVWEARRDERRGWELLRARQAANETAITAMDDAPSDARTLPIDCRFLMIEGLVAATSKTITVELYAWPPDPGTGTAASENDTDGEAAGWLVGTYTLSSSARQQTGVAAGTADQYQTEVIKVDLAGAHKFAARITSVGGSTAELIYRAY